MRVVTLWDWCGSFTMGISSLGGWWGQRYLSVAAMAFSFSAFCMPPSLHCPHPLSTLPLLYSHPYHWTSTLPPPCTRCTPPTPCIPRTLSHRPAPLQAPASMHPCTAPVPSHRPAALALHQSTPTAVHLFASRTSTLPPLCVLWTAPAPSHRPPASLGLHQHLPRPCIPCTAPAPSHSSALLALHQHSSTALRSLHCSSAVPPRCSPCTAPAPSLSTAPRAPH